MAGAVSTHSRLKAAGARAVLMRLVRTRFNTQPPEGGWDFGRAAQNGAGGFNTQPPEGGWDRQLLCRRCRGSFNTQPPEGGWRK